MIDVLKEKNNRMEKELKESRKDVAQKTEKIKTLAEQ